MRNKSVAVDYGMIVIGTVLMSMGIKNIFDPANMVTGGVTGAAIIFKQIWNVPLWLSNTLLNIPLFIAAFKIMGWTFIKRTLFATVMLSVALYVIPDGSFMQDDLFLSALFGGIIGGVGIGLVFLARATTGGTDMLAKMVHQKLPFISTGMFLMIIDCVVVIFAAVCIGTTEALFALVCIFINGKVIDMVMLGLSKNKACFVMSDKWAEISHQVLHDMDRGATQLSARGAYSGKERPVLLCVLPPQEVARFKEIVRKEDDRAFMFITEAHEALGEGFDRLAEKD